MLKLADSSSDVVVPKFDKTAAIICIGFWFISQCVATNYEAYVKFTFLHSFHSPKDFVNKIHVVFK